MVNVWRNRRLVSFTDASAHFTTGRLTPRELLERCLEAIDSRDGVVKAFVVLNAQAARKSADESSRRYKFGTPLSVVDGCPLAVKDIIATNDMPTQMNSSIFEGFQPRHDAAAVSALRTGGAIIVGKTVTTEFAISRSGPTTNPFDQTRTPGGSSSGSAAAVAAGMVPVALATQTQGSLLRPASYCGAVGFKPTINTLHTGGIHPLSPTCDHLGVIAGSLDDAWRIASHISLAIGSPGLLSGAAPDLPPPAAPRKLIRLYTRGWAEVDSETRDAFEGHISSVEAAGVQISSRDNNPVIAALERDLDAHVDDALAIVAYEMKWPYEDYIDRFGTSVGTRIHELVTRALSMTVTDYRQLLCRRANMQAVVQRLAGEYDGFITLAASGPAIKGLEFTGSRTFQVYSSWLGLPAFTLPLLEVAGLPVGVQLLGFADGDGALCARAHWMLRMPSANVVDTGMKIES